MNIWETVIDGLPYLSDLTYELAKKGKGSEEVSNYVEKTIKG